MSYALAAGRASRSLARPAARPRWGLFPPAATSKRTRVRASSVLGGRAAASSIPPQGPDDGKRSTIDGHAYRFVAPATTHVTAATEQAGRGRARRSTAVPTSPRAPSAEATAVPSRLTTLTCDPSRIRARQWQEGKLGLCQNRRAGNGRPAVAAPAPGSRGTNRRAPPRPRQGRASLDARGIYSTRARRAEKLRKPCEDRV
jgi:hypothetical protein